MGLAPTTIDELVATVSDAHREARTLHPVGGGTRSRRGSLREPAETLSTTNLTRVVDHIPAELTITVEAGLEATVLAERLAAAGQWWPQADVRPGSTIGGILATAASGRGRLRHGPVRDSLLEVVMVTGDGRLVTAGGRTVKGVAGYDIPRLAVGSHGSLGVIAQVTLKLWPLPPARGWFHREGTLAERLAAARHVLTHSWRPAAVLLSPGRVSVDLQGPAADITAPDGFTPASEPADPTGLGLVDVGVPARALAELVATVEARGLPYLAQAGVGTCRVGVNSVDDVRVLHTTALSLEGHAVVIDGPDDFRDRGWGDPPVGAAIMSRIKHAFDPGGILPAPPATSPSRP